MIKVNSNKVAFTRSNFWNHFHFHPTDAIEDPWGQELLEAVKKDNVARTIRMYAMLEDIVYEEDGKLAYDFRDLDTRLDYLTQNGFNIVMCMNFLPSCIAKEPQHSISGERYKGKILCNSTPRDFKEWQEICATVIRHVIDRYGEEEVSKWYIQCWNEPNLSFFWMVKEPDLRVRFAEYLKLYDYFVEGIRSVSKKVKVGGPVLSSGDLDELAYPELPPKSMAPDIICMDMFYNHIKDGVNHANGGKGTEIDFVSLHAYGKLRQFNQIDPMDCYISASTQIKMIRDYGFTDVEFIIDEWEANAEGFLGMDQFPGFEYRNTTVLPTYFFALIDLYAKKELPITKMLMCMSGMHELQTEFPGTRTFVSKSGFRLPVYNGFVLAAMMGEQFLAYENDTKVDVIPTMDADGNVVVALYNYTPNRLKLKGTQHVNFEVLLPEGDYKVSHYRLDENNCNCYTAWKKLGSKEALTQMERNAVLEAQKVKLFYPEETFSGSTFTDSVVMPDDSVSIIKFTRI